MNKNIDRMSRKELIEQACKMEKINQQNQQQNNNLIKKCAIYVRVSTLEQQTLNQEIELKEYCARQGYEIFRLYKDEGVSGSKTSRQALNEMLNDMRQGFFNTILIWKLDRLGRSTQHLLQLLEEFNNRNIKLIITSMGLDTTTPQGKFFFTIIGAVAELEREMIRERIKLGLERRRKQGKPLGRQKGAKDKAMRKRLGYYQRWSNKKTTPYKTNAIIRGIN